MASDTVKSRRYYLPTSELYETASKFGSSVPAFNNIYDVFINFDAKSQLRSFIEQHNMHYGNKAVGSSLALYCSEAVLPGSQLQTTSVDGLNLISLICCLFCFFFDAPFFFFASKICLP